MPNNITPVVLCGGLGTHLWPLSRKAMPKQFSSFDGGLSLLQSTVKRMENCGFLPPLMITGEDYRFTLKDQLHQIDAHYSAILTEPEGRNTAPAICAAAEHLKSADEEALMLIVPSDQMVHNQMALKRAVSAGVKHAIEGHVVSFGIAPDRAETGFGYIELSDLSAGGETAQRALHFVEKPDAEGAQHMIDTGRYVWNAGIYLLSVRTALHLFEQHQPILRSQVRLSIRDIDVDLGFSRLGPSYADARAVSFEKAALEHECGFVVPVDAGWADLGSWQSVWRESETDIDGVATTQTALAIDCEDCLLRSEDENMAVVGIGLKNIAAVVTRDAVLISDMEATVSVSLAVTQMRQSNVRQTDVFPRYDRPWGYYETLLLGDRFQVKSIVVKPNGKLSLQSHMHRSEHWVVVEGSATVTVGSQRKLIGENVSVYIPQGEVHRLENEGKLPLKLIEVQTGCYLGEDDITRHDDAYSRA